MLCKYELSLLQQKMEMSKMKHNKQRQFEILVDFMKAHPNLSKSVVKTANGRNTATNLWKKLSSQLNATGPPMRDVAGWKKVWSDYKTHLRAKMRRNKQSVSGTGGGPSVFVPLSKLEEEVSNLLGVEQSISGISNAVRFGAGPVVRRECPVMRRDSPVVRHESPVVRQESPEVRQESSEESGNSGSEPSEHGEEIASENSEENDLPTCSNTTNTPRKKQSLLEHQLENQIKFHKSSTKVLNDINCNLINICNIQKRRLKLEEEKFLYQQKVDHQKIKLKLNKLELQKNVLDIELKTNNLVSTKRQ